MTASIIIPEASKIAAAASPAAVAATAAVASSPDTPPAAPWQARELTNNPRPRICESLADAVEAALDRAGEQAEQDAKRARESEEQARGQLASVRQIMDAFGLRNVQDAKTYERLEQCARDLLADYERVMDDVGVKATHAQRRMQDALYDLDRRKLR